MSEIKEGTVMANDPSLTAWGWAILNWESEVLDAGCIKTEPESKKRRIRKGDDNVRRLSDMCSLLLTIITKNDVQYILSELPHGSQNASGAFMIGAVTGVIQTIGDCVHLAVEWYSENDAKTNLFNKKAITKKEMIDKIDQVYKNVPWKNVKYKDEAIADALAIHSVALKNSSTLKFMKTK